jgi:hypothetical protein
LKPLKDVDKVGVTGALTLTNRPPEMRTRMKTKMKMTCKRNLLPLRPGFA